MPRSRYRTGATKKTNKMLYFGIPVAPLRVKILKNINKY